MVFGARVRPVGIVHAAPVLDALRDLLVDEVAHVLVPDPVALPFVGQSSAVFARVRADPVHVPFADAHPVRAQIVGRTGEDRLHAHGAGERVADEPGGVASGRVADHVASQRVAPVLRDPARHVEAFRLVRIPGGEGAHDPPVVRASVRILPVDRVVDHARLGRRVEHRLVPVVERVAVRVHAGHGGLEPVLQPQAGRIVFDPPVRKPDGPLVPVAFRVEILGGGRHDVSARRAGRRLEGARTPLGEALRPVASIVPVHDHAIRLCAPARPGTVRRGRA